MRHWVDVQKLWDDVVAERDVLCIRGHVEMTKGPAGEGTGLFMRDHELEERTSQWLQADGCSRRQLLERFSSLDEQVPEWPAHAAARTVAVEGVFASGENVFIVFPLSVPYVQASRCPDFGIEFIDTWEAALWEVMFPCVRRMLTAKSGCDLALALGPDISVVVFGVAVLHEVGHQVGFFRVLPEREPKNRTDPYLSAAISELYTDCSVAATLSGTLAAATFILLYRTLWFGRRGCLEGVGAGRLNVDSDCLIGVYLWERARREGVIGGHVAPYEVVAEVLPRFFASIRADIDALGSRLRHMECSEEQSHEVRGWLSRFVPWDGAARQWVLPEDFLQMCEACRTIPENPAAPQRGSVAVPLPSLQPPDRAG